MELNMFKYVDSKIIEHLLLQKIRFTQPDALNDPFEMKRFRERHIEEATPELWEAPHTATRIIMDQIMSHPAEVPSVAAIDSTNVLISSALEYVKNALSGAPTAEWTGNILSAQGQAFATPLGEEEMRDKRKQAQTFIDKMDKYGILSMTQHNDNLLMWAHYAEEHRGAVFEIDVDNEAFCAGFTMGPYDDEKADEWRGDVRYPERRVAPPVSHAEFIASFFLKSPQWCYEAEYRIIRRLEKGSKLGGTTDRTGHDIYLFPLPANCIQRLIFGARFDDALRGHIMSIIRSRPELAHVMLSQAQLSQDVYGLKITPLTA